jgi:hypothetical protein
VVGVAAPLPSSGILLKRVDLTTNVLHLANHKRVHETSGRLSVVFARVPAELSFPSFLAHRQNSGLSNDTEVYCCFIQTTRGDLVVENAPVGFFLYLMLVCWACFIGATEPRRIHGPNGFMYTEECSCMTHGVEKLRIHTHIQFATPNLKKDTRDESATHNLLSVNRD